jgi:hypothetical protein
VRDGVEQYDMENLIYANPNVCWVCYVVNLELLNLSLFLCFFACYQISHKLDP